MLIPLELLKIRLKIKVYYYFFNNKINYKDDILITKYRSRSTPKNELIRSSIR